MTPKLNCAAAAALAALGGALMSGCSGDDTPINNLPTGVTQQNLTVYPATTTGPGDLATTQDLLTAGLGRTRLGAAKTSSPTRKPVTAWPASLTTPLTSKPKMIGIIMGKVNCWASC